MSMAYWSRTTCTVAIAVAFFGYSDASAWGDEGIDLVLLVDVSRSMVQIDKEGDEKDGSDPERIRWDAVKAVADLLGPGDRLMICRFNHGCPALYGNAPSAEDPKIDDAQMVKNSREKIDDLIKKHPQKDFFQLWRSDFEMEFRLLSRERGALESKINSFNQTDDKIDPPTGQPWFVYKPNSKGESEKTHLGAVGYLDGGGTKIVKALATVGNRLRSARPGSTLRQMHVIVLTDGRDEDYGKYRDQASLENSKLLEDLKFFAGGAKRIPIHCVGFNLKAARSDAKSGLQVKVDPKADAANEARTLLHRISHITGGSFKEIHDNHGLLDFFLCLTKSIRQYWVEEIKVLGSNDQKHVEETILTKGLSELGVLSYCLAAKDDIKHPIKPTEDEPKFEWIGTEDIPKADSVRMGKNASLYRYFYFGPNADSEGDVQSSPFKHFNKDVTLQIALSPSTTEQRLVLLKGTLARLFELKSPYPDQVIGRFERIRIQVAMIPSKDFSFENAPNYFRLTARVRHLNSAEAGNSETILPGTFCTGSENASVNVDGDVIELEPRKTLETGPLVFEAEVPRSRLAAAVAPIDYYEVSVTAFGSEKPKHALSRTRLDLPPRIFGVRNSLDLSKVADIELSTDQGGDSRHFVVEKAKTKAESNGDIPLQIKFTPPKIDGETISREYFNVTSDFGEIVLAKDGTSPFSLKDGLASIRVNLTSQSQSLKRGVVYEPGQFEVTAPDIVMKPLVIGVKLRMGLSSVELQRPPKELRVIEGSQSESMSVVLTKGPIGSGPVNVTLKFLGAADSQRMDATDFGEELWLEKDGETDVDPTRRNQTIQVNVGDKHIRSKVDLFRVRMNPVGTKVPMKYKCRLTVSGDWIDSTTHDFFLDKDSAAIELEKTLIHVPIGRGLSRRIQTKAWLSGGTVGERASVYIQGVGSDELVQFERKGVENEGHAFLVECQSRVRPVELYNIQKGKDEQPDNKREIEFVISVPDGAPYGRYWKEFILFGETTKQQMVCLEVDVDGLEIDLLTGTDEGGGNEGQWKLTTERSLVQLLRTPMKQTLRIRTGLGESLVEDEISIAKVKFSDENGDVPLNPVRFSKIRLEDRGKAALVDVHFPVTPNANNEVTPYTLELEASARSGVPGNQNDKFVKPIRFNFHIRYLGKNEIVKVRSLPIDQEPVK